MKKLIFSILCATLLFIPINAWATNRVTVSDDISGTKWNALLPNCRNPVTEKLLYNDTLHQFVCGTDGGGTGGSGTPGGANTQVQFNDSDVFAGDSGFTYNKTTDKLTVLGDVSVGVAGTGILTATSGISFDPDNDASNEVTISTAGLITSVGINSSGGTTTLGTVAGTVNASGALLELPNATSCTGTDCDAAEEAGRICIDTDATSGQQLYVCEGVIGWVLQGDGGPGAGDISAVGNCSTGACFGGASGTSLTFDGAPSTDGILSYSSVGFNLDKALTLGSAGVKLSGDDDGAITFAGIGNGYDEDLTLNLDDTSNVGVLSSSTGLATLDFGSIGADFDSSTVVLSTVTGAIDAGGATSLEIPNGTNPTVNAAGECAFDTTDDQIKCYGSAERVYAYEQTRCKTVDNVVAGDDNQSLGMWGDGVTITGVGCSYVGTGTTPATITLEDGSGNAMTITGTNPTCVAHGTDATFAAVTAGNTLSAGEILRYDTTNTPSPETDDYTFCVKYTVTAQ